ncbi:MAG: hypothetical protein COB49_11390 [Alphaproteobacteria bacterium]|nr:MAG: hypothetical protein COB49_11390 [Alphaproteobacteria bacterium]
MNFRKINLMLIGIMVLISLLILTSALTALYQSAFKKSRENLTRTALSQARLIESLAVFDQEHNSSFSEGWLAITLAQIDMDFKSLEKIGETGEFLLARKQGGDIDFLLVSPRGSQSVPSAVPFVSALAEPMSRALKGKGGIMTGIDYDGVRVLAAYQPIKKLNFGIVVKIDIAEIRAPFLKIGVILVSFSILLTVIGSALFLKVNNPMIRRVKESEHRYRNIIKNTEVIAWELDLNTFCFTYVSLQAEKLLGIPTEEWKAENFWVDHIHPDDRESSILACNVATKAGEKHDFEYRMLKADGCYIWMRDIVTVNKDAVGHPVSLSGFLININNEKGAQEKLISSENRYERAIAGTKDGIWDWNAQTDEGYFSPRCAEILGYDVSDLEPVVKTFADIVHPNDREEVWASVNAHMEHNEPFDIEFRMRKKNGDYIWIQCRGSVSRDDAGQPTFMAGSITDITKRKDIEDRLVIAKQEAVDANLAKSEFLASMSHELRTPLNAILGFGQMLQIDSEDILIEKKKEYVEYILSGGNHLLKLINEILDLSQIEADQTSILLEDVDPEEVISSCIAQISPLGVKRGITVFNKVEINNDNLIRTDNTRFQQIIINLLSNAVKYNKDGGSITVASKITRTGFLHISVSDTGIGIDKMYAVSIFNIFKRIERNSKVAGEGTGIGLAICKLLTEQMGGRINFESTIGEGSTFWVELPLVSNKEILIWSDSLRTGIDAIDKDHQIIIGLNNKISSGISDEKNLDDIILKVVEYTKYHFKREEAIMELCDYPELKKHRGYHKKLVTKINKLARDWQKNEDPEIRESLSIFLRNWWMGHIMEVDTTIVQYANGKEREIKNKLAELK